MDELIVWSNEEEFAAVMRAAEAAISTALRDGKLAGHGAGSYRAETIENQLRHLEAHITAYQCGDHNEDHLSHIVCRAVIAYALAERAASAARPAATIPPPEHRPTPCSNWPLCSVCGRL